MHSQRAIEPLLRVDFAGDSQRLFRQCLWSELSRSHGSAQLGRNDHQRDELQLEHLKLVKQ